MEYLALNQAAAIFLPANDVDNSNNAVEAEVWETLGDTSDLEKTSRVEENRELSLLHLRGSSRDGKGGKSEDD